MNNNTYKQFAGALLAVAPDFPLDAAEIEAYIRANGFQRFSNIMDSYDPWISEVTNLLSIFSRGGAPNGEG